MSCGTACGRRDGSTTYVYSDTDSYAPLARIDTPDRAREYTRIYWYHTRPDGTPEQLSDRNGEEVWRIVNDAWGRVDTAWGEINSAAVREDNLRMQGQYLDRETGLHYNLFRYYDADSMHFISPDPIGLAGGLNLYAYAPDPLNWADPLGLKCIQNKIDGTAREIRAQAILERRYGKDNVLRERYLRDMHGKSVKDPMTGERRRIDFVVKGQDGKWRPVEITSRTATKDAQLDKELRIHEAGGIFVRNPNTRELIQLDDISTVIRVR